MTNKYILNPNFQHFQKNLLNIEEIFSSSNETIHKARNELKIVELDGVKYVIKSFKKPHFLNRVIYTFFRQSKAKKSYLNAMQLFALSVETPTPVGVIEFFENALLSKSYFISLYQPYDFTIREVIHHTIKEYKTVLKEFALFTVKVHKQGVWHEDYSLGNILISQDKEFYSFSLVDINRMKFTHISAQKGLSNLNKLWFRDEEDMKIVASTYAKKRGFDEEKAFEILKAEQKKIKQLKERKKLLKKTVGK